MRYLECRYDRSGYGTYIRAQIKTNLYDYYVVSEDFDISNIGLDKIIDRNEFLNSRLKNLNRDDIVVMTCNDLEGLPGIEKSNCTKILTLHDITPLRVKYLSKAKKMKWRNVVQKALKACDYVITVSNFSKKNIQEEFDIPSSKIFVVYNYAQNVEGKLNLNNVSEIKCIDKVKNAEYIFSTVGSMNLNKNFIRTALAWKKSRYFKQSILIAMSKKNSMAFRILLTLLGVKKKVIVPGYVTLEQLASLYYISDLFIFTTLREGFGVPPLEAMGLGIPVLTSNTSCMEEILGNAAVYVNPYKLKDISNGIDQILQDKALKAKLIENGRMKTKEYSSERFYNQMTYVFEKMCK